jgi:hypothetical protein
VRYWRKYGDRHLVDRIRKAHKLIEAAYGGSSDIEEIVAEEKWLSCRDELKPTTSRFSEIERHAAMYEALRTLATIRSVIEGCAAKKPKARLIRGASFRRTNIQSRCLSCDKPTEIEAFNIEEKSAFDWLNGVHSTPSSKYCTEHRRNNLRKVSCANYKRNLRNRPKYLVELRNLEIASCRSSVDPPGGKLVADFYSCLVEELDAWLDDTDKLWNAARTLVDEKMSDQKKRIVMLSACGCSQAKIARLLGLYPQLVSKSLKSIPKAYLDLPKSYLADQPNPRLSNAYSV